MEAQAQSTLAQYGPIGLACIVFAAVIVYLFKLVMSRTALDEERVKEIAEERKGWDVEREKIRAEYAEKAEELAASYAKDLLAERNANRAHEDLVRKEFVDLMERLSDENVKASEDVVQILQKFHDRFVGPRRR